FIVGGPVGDFELLLCHGTVCVVGKIRDLILQLSKSSIYSTKPRPLAVIFVFYTLGTAVIGHHYWDMTGDAVVPNMINFYKNVSIAGAFILLAITGPGAISLDRR
ncbi:DoxX family protein, partial [Enterobacter hormaechei]